MANNKKFIFTLLLILLGTTGIAPMESSVLVIPDGVDDQIEIQAAFEQYKSVKLAEGIFSTSAPIIMPSGSKLVGSGSKTILMPAAAITVIQSQPGNSHIKISNLTIDGNWVDSYITAMYFRENNYVDLISISVINSSHMGVFFEDSSYNNIRDSRFVNNGSIGGDSALWFSRGERNSILRNSFIGNQNGSCSQGANYTRVLFNYYEANNFDAVNLTYAGGDKPHSQGFLIAHNIIKGPSQPGTQGIHLNRMENGKVFRNKISGVGGHGIALDYSNYVKVRWNDISNTGWSGIVLYNQGDYGASYNLIEDNSVYQVSLTEVDVSGIDIGNAYCNYNKVIGNTIRKGNSPFQRFGIRIQSGAAYNEILGNDIRDGYLDLPILDDGIGTIIEGNKW